MKNFPPLNYLFYPATPEKYITFMENPWSVSSAALDFFEEICATVQDYQLLRIVQSYHTNPTAKLAKKIAKLLCHTKHKAVPDYLFSLLCQAASEYPRRSFGKEIDASIQAQLEKADKLCATVRQKHQTALAYREEPFVYDCDDLTFKIYIMLLQDGRIKRKIKVQQLDNWNDF